MSSTIQIFAQRSFAHSALCPTDRPSYKGATDPRKPKQLIHLPNHTNQMIRLTKWNFDERVSLVLPACRRPGVITSIQTYNLTGGFVILLRLSIGGGDDRVVHGPGLAFLSHCCQISVVENNFVSLNLSA